MKFADLQILWFLWLIVPLSWLLIFFIKRRKDLLMKFAKGRLWERLTESVNWQALNFKYTALVFVFVFSLAAMARPQFGFTLQEVKRQGVDILLAVDVSKSMLTRDVSPNRLERTKLAVRDLIDQLHGDRVGLIAFSGDAFLLCPLTPDYGGVMMSMESLEPAIIPRGGTNVAAAIDEALDIYAEHPSQYKTLVILTDGENLEGDPVAAAREAKSRGMKIYTVGIGTKEGELVSVPEGNGHEFLKDREGNVVKSRLNESLLQEIALKTGGFYVRSGGARFGLDVIYDQALSKMDRTEFEGQMKRRYFERFQWPLALSVILLVAEMAIPVRKKKKEDGRQKRKNG
ncbi:MAG: VWA domain-containing protein [Candidatus Omnitrophota bacterium]